MLNPTAWVVVGAIGAALIGAVIGTLGGAEARQKLVAANGGHDLPVALVEDAIAIVGGFAVVALVVGHLNGNCGTANSTRSSSAPGRRVRHWPVG